MATFGCITSMIKFKCVLIFRACQNKNQFDFPGTWTSDDSLYSVSLWSYLESVDLNNPCIDMEDIDSATLFSGEYNLHYHNDHPYVFASSTGTRTEGFLTFSQANAYCSINFGTTLATIKTHEQYDQVTELMEDYGDSHHHLFIGLYDDDNDGVFHYDSEYDGTFDFVDYCTTVDCGCGTYETAFTSGDYLLQRTCDDDLDFLCDLTIYENDRFIGIYTYDVDYTWQEANEYCDQKYGTELATTITLTK